MADYKKMYLTMLRASEDAINTLIQAQRECEEMFISEPQPEIHLLEPKQSQAPSPAGNCLPPEEEGL